jgi:putative ABC transport system permease protein
VPIAAGLDASPLGIALAFGYLVTLAFALWPLAIARTVAPTTLFRMAAVSGRQVPEPRFLAMIALCLALLAVLALVVLANRNLTAWYLFGLAASFVLLSGLAAALMWAAEKWVRPKGAVLRYAVANLYRPGAPTGSIVVSLGLGLALFVTLALMDRNISAELRASVPEQAPSFFFLDVQSSELDDLLALLDAQPDCMRSRPRRCCAAGCSGSTGCRCRGASRPGGRLGGARRPRLHLCARPAAGLDAGRRRVVAGRL